MSTTSRRVLTVTVAAIVAVLTGVVVGLLSARTSCTPVLAPAATGTPAAPAPTSAAPSPAAGLGGSHAEPVRPSAPPAEQAVVAERQPVCGSSDTFEPLPALAALGGAGLAGLAVLVLMLAGALTGRRTVPVVAGRGPVQPVAPGPVAASRRTEAERAALVRACIYVRDRITSKALADRLGAALREAGVSVVEPAGERFDPAHHEAGGAAPSDDPNKVGTIAAVEVPGYNDRGHILRAPVVTVYQAAGKQPRLRPAEREDPSA
jgi:hypothetical protein